MGNQERIDAALDIAVRYGGIDGAHHKDWVIDQMVRILTGDGYECFVTNAKQGDDGPDTYEWNEGIPMTAPTIEQKARELYAEWHRKSGCGQQVIADCLSGVIQMPELAHELVISALSQPAKAGVVGHLYVSDQNVQLCPLAPAKLPDAEIRKRYGNGTHDLIVHTPASAAGDGMVLVPEYTTAMGQAATDYIDAKCRMSSGEYAIRPPLLPGDFRWEELYAAMLTAAQASGGEGG